MANFIIERFPTPTVIRRIFSFRPHIWLLLFCLLFPLSALKAEKIDPYHGDTVLYKLATQVFDSVKAPSFFKLQREGLEQAVKKGNEYYINIFHRMTIARYDVLKDEENFLLECDKLITYYKKRKEKECEKYLYDVWYQKMDRLQMWGKHNEALQSTKEMADYAQQHQHKLGEGLANFCFGMIYLDNRQPKEAEKYYRLAYDRLYEMERYHFVLRAGFNLIAIALNTNSPEKGLKVSDDNARIIKNRIADGDIIPSVTQMKQALYRMRLLVQLKRYPEAEMQRDSVYHYNNIQPDPSQQAIIISAVADFNQNRGHYAEAIEGYESLLNRFLKEGNYLKVANHRYSLANIYRLQGNYKKAMETYRQYAIDNDSANIESTSAQLNELTKKFRLIELEQENKLAETERGKAMITAIGAGATALLIAVVCILLVVYSRRVSQKNKVLLEQLKQYVAYLKTETVSAPAETVTVSTESTDTFTIDSEDTATETQSTASLQKLYMQLDSLMQNEKPYLRSDLTRDYLTEQLGTNKNRLTASVQAGIGLSVSDYINEYRLREGLLLLEGDPDVSLTEIADQTGFGTYSSFYRAFLKRFGVKPAEYRKFMSSKN